MTCDKGAKPIQQNKDGLVAGAMGHFQIKKKKKSGLKSHILYRNQLKMAPILNGKM